MCASSRRLMSTETSLSWHTLYSGLNEYECHYRPLCCHRKLLTRAQQTESKLRACDTANWLTLALADLWRRRFFFRQGPLVQTAGIIHLHATLENRQHPHIHTTSRLFEGRARVNQADLMLSPALAMAKAFAIVVNQQRGSTTDTIHSLF